MSVIEPFAALHHQAVDLGVRPPEVVLDPRHFDHLLGELGRTADLLAPPSSVELYGIKVWRGLIATTTSSGGGGDGMRRCSEEP